MSTPHLNVQSVALYGSTARGDTDIHSDCDILLVDDSVAQLQAAARTLRSRGYSCATYTWSRLAHMLIRGSLFVQHLKTEAVILRDHQGRLGAFLHSYSPLGDYSADIDATRDVIASADAISDCPWSIGWASDVLAVAVRNIGILHLANEGKYYFSFDGVLGGLRELGQLTNSDIASIRTLRTFKARYRSRHIDRLPSLKDYLTVHRLVTRRFRVDLDLRVLRRETLASHLIDRAALHRSKYCRLRLAEGAVTGCMSRITRTPSTLITQFNNILTKQNEYGLISHDIAGRLEKVSRLILNHEFGQQ